MMAKNWIQGAIKRPGALHRALGVPEGDKIPAKKLNAAANSSNTRVREEANLAKTLKGMQGGGKHTEVKSDRGTFKHRNHRP